jgi:hypothetical protein
MGVCDDCGDPRTKGKNMTADAGHTSSEQSKKKNWQGEG